MEKIERIDVCTFGCRVCLGTSPLKIEEVNPARIPQPEEAHQEAEHAMNVLKDYVATNEFSLIVNSLRKTLPRTWTDNLNQLKKEALRDQAISDDLLRFWDKHIMKLAYYGDAFIRRGNIVIRRATWDEGITILEDAICALWIVSGLEHRPGIFGHTPE